MKSLIESLESRRLLTNVIVTQSEPGATVFVEPFDPEQGTGINIEWRYSYREEAVKVKINGYDYSASELIVYGSGGTDDIIITYKPSILVLTNGNDFTRTIINAGAGDDLCFVDAEAGLDGSPPTLDLTLALEIDMGSGNDVWGGNAMGYTRDDAGFANVYFSEPEWVRMLMEIDTTSADMTTAFLPNGIGYGNVGFGTGSTTVLFDTLPLPTSPAAYHISGVGGWTPWASLGGNRHAPVSASPAVKFSAIKIDDVLAGDDVLASVAA